VTGPGGDGPGADGPGGVPSVDQLRDGLERQNYFADDGILTAVYLAMVLGRPLLVEGEPGVGKTELARSLAGLLGRDLVRLQCYEGLDAAQALYEWDYPRQLLAVRAGGDVGDLYSDEFLLERPLLRAVRAGDKAVLLIDEIDRADSEFEAFLLEFLDAFQITVPERGTVRADRPPLVVVTSNRTRELHDAFKRRCMYHWIPFPGPERERDIIRAHAPGVDEAAARALVDAVGAVRSLRLVKAPGTAETIDWARGACTLAGQGHAWPDALRRSLGLLLKEQDDVEMAVAEVPVLRAPSGGGW
jgi:MoxR-like ATPase